MNYGNRPLRRTKSLPESMRVCHHKKLCNQEARKLQIKGFSIEFEKKVLPHHIVDVFARKGHITVIVECGYCPSERLKRLKKVVDKVFHTPYLSQWIRYSDWDWRGKQYREMLKHIGFDYKSMLKQT